MLRRRYQFEALSELIATARYYDEREPGLGEEFIDEVEAIVEQIRATPKRFPPTLAGCRQARTRKFNYQIIYRVDPAEGVVVVAVKHPARDPNYWVGRVDGEDAADEF